MLRRFLLISVAIALAVTAFVASHIEIVYGGFIIAYGAGAIDPVGEVKLAYSKATRDCSQIARLGTQQMNVLLNDSAVRGKIQDQIAAPRTGWQIGDWMLVETDFDNAEPAVFLMKKNSSSIELAAVYGGTASPFNDTQVIHQYFLEGRPDVPRNLVLCYEPVGAPFSRAW